MFLLLCLNNIELHKTLFISEITVITAIKVRSVLKTFLGVFEVTNSNITKFVVSKRFLNLKKWDL